jgi:hypothetical protein
VKALNLRRCQKGSLLAFLDLELPSGLILRGCTLHDSDGRKWVGLPGKPYKDAAGKDVWANIIDFRDRSTRNNFQKQATAAALAAYGAAERAA